MLTATTLGGRPDRPLLVLGPSLGTSAETLWARCAARLDGRFHVVGWDLPGHGRSPARTSRSPSPDLAAAVLALVDRAPVRLRR